MFKFLTPYVAGLKVAAATAIFTLIVGLSVVE